MVKIYLIRYSQNDQGTRGIVVFDNFKYHSLELPWRDNQRNISCIPEGEYYVTNRVSPAFGKVYWLRNVPNRSYIYIHSGNVAGDEAKGYKSHVDGCILLGKYAGELWGQRAVLNSKRAIREFTTKLDWQDFKLDILDFSRSY